VARAADAIQRGLARPDRVLLLAFNKAAASELRQRIDDGRPQAASQPRMCGRRRSLVRSRADAVFGDGLSRLATELISRGIELDWNPDRPIQGVRPLDHADLARLVRTFMSHIKSNSLTPSNVTSRLEVEHRRLLGFRTQLFLDLYWPIHHEWNRRLRDDDSVDFEDMLVQAAEHLETDPDDGGVDMGYDLIMVDEFQDASHARARLIAGLLRRPGKYLVAVGDDWQAINRFAGADLSVMLQFEEWFGAGSTCQQSGRSTPRSCQPSRLPTARRPRHG
jgi:DNA helicase-4